MKSTPLFSPTPHHPLVMTPDGDNSLVALGAYLEANRDGLQQSLLRHGGLLFRGFEVKTVEDFRECTRHLGAVSFDYVGGNSPRTRVLPEVYTSTEYPATETISLHNEMSYLPSWPSRLFFYSLIPAISGGQTSLAHSVDVLEAVPDEVVSKMRDRKIRYIRNFHAGLPLGKTWQATYQTDSREEVEEIVAGQGSTCEWRADGGLRVSTVRDAFVAHPVTGQDVWFNQAEQWHRSALDPALREMFEKMVGSGNLPHECEYGDGAPLDDRDMAAVRKAMNDNKLLFDWKHGDVLVIDNLLMMHGREPFKGERKTLAYLSVN
ncbi:TauD/TfdA family dioxygenase [Marilutibacter chinensis]|uniref:TauD/TfdA family dioxygenase n=1 Tax=Marilutibacter chinensis TaxID=2912247 RepID=A0ABS9HXN5_9GAMM|nr:TauD/TfdA family dioxygenase [Lysobacter chinensis]MCF7223316.1 TauD/TfdA family dioxygenase [Lysobacter chinensis]